VVRAQKVPPGSGFSQHFRISCWQRGSRRRIRFTASGSRHTFKPAHALNRLETCGYSFGARRIEILATAERAQLADRIAKSLGARPADRRSTSLLFGRPAFQTLGHVT